MPGKNDANLMTSVQVRKQLNSIHTDKIEIKNSLQNIVEQFQCLDHVAKSVGLLKEEFSFINRVSWKTILDNLKQSDKNETELKAIPLNDIIEVASQSSNQLENEIIPKLQKWRNNWMVEVILIEFVFLVIFSLATAGLTHVQGLWNLSNFEIPVTPFLYERPVFSLISGVLLLMSFIVMHFRIRNFVARLLVRKINKESSEFDLAGAFLKNTLIQHSIFSPDIVGFGWLNRKCLQRSQN